MGGFLGFSSEGARLKRDIFNPTGRHDVNPALLRAASETVLPIHTILVNTSGVWTSSYSDWEQKNCPLSGSNPSRVTGWKYTNSCSKKPEEYVSTTCRCGTNFEDRGEGWQPLSIQKFLTLASFNSLVSHLRN